MSTCRSSFDIGTAALEHLELLNQSNQNPLEVAAQFRTLLRSKKDDQNHIPIDAPIPTPENLSVPSPPSDKPINRFSYPRINWKYLRQKRYEYKLEQFFSLKFPPKTLTLSSLTTVSDQTESSCTYSNISLLREHFQRIRSPSPSIRTPCISPIGFSQPIYTISRLNTTSMNHDDILFPIADCNLIIKHKPPRIPHLSTVCL